MCDHPRMPATPSVASLDGTTWTTVSPAGTTATIAFEAGRAAGLAGVNRYAGEASGGDGTISLGPLAVTRMAGPEQAMRDEDAFLAALAAVAVWSIVEGRLELRSADGALLLTFAPDDPDEAA